MNGKITKAPYYEVCCPGCAVYWRACLLAPSPRDSVKICPFCIDDEALDADVAENDNAPHCECRGVCPRCTPGA